VSPELATAVAAQWQSGWLYLRGREFVAAASSFEKMHVLGQWYTGTHVRAHWGLLCVGIAAGDFREMVGQGYRLVAAVLLTWAGWIPAGNTGRARVSPWKPMPLDAEAQKLLRGDPRSAKALARHRI
jgi:hypothetical protein